MKKIYNERIHKHRMKTDWEYRWKHTSVSIHNLRLWKEHILEHNQFERAMIQLAEAQDIPYELWDILTSADICEYAGQFRAAQKTVGTPAFKDVKPALLQLAAYHFTSAYATLKKITMKDAERHMEDLLDSLGIEIAGDVTQELATNRVGK